ncbi:hypothetical protein OSK38_25935, partial [Escherichia coli]|nr:hypothetical protein [Escherichia coli]
DYSGGLLDFKIINRGSDINSVTSTVNALTDNNETTNFSLSQSGSSSDTLWYEFATPVSIDSYRLKSASSSGLVLGYVSETGASGTISNTVDASGSLVSLTGLPKIKKIYLINSSSSAISVNEFNLYQTQKTYGELSNLTLSATHIAI